MRKIYFEDCFGTARSSGGIGRDSENLQEATKIFVKTIQNTILVRKKTKTRRRLMVLLLRYVNIPLLRIPISRNSMVIRPQITPFSYSLKKTTVVVRIHDLFPLQYPNWYSPKTHLWFKKSIMRNFASAIYICNSNYTAHKLVENFPEVKKSQIHVCYCDIKILTNDKCHKCQGCLSDERGEFILAIGTIEARKNYETLILGFKKARAISPELKLVIVGRSGKDSQSLINKYAGEVGVFFTGAICDGSLKDLYSTCAAFISTSLDEGFDIPSMEAAEFKTKLLLSDIKVHRELHGEHALYFDPTSANEISEVILGLSMAPRGEVQNFVKEQSLLRQVPQILSTLYTKKGIDHIF